MSKYLKGENGSPAYLQLYQQLRRDIVQGFYAHGSKLPSKRAMAEKSALSLITVEHAYDLLVEEGYVEPRERSGFFVVFSSNDSAREQGERHPWAPTTTSELAQSAFQKNAENFPPTVLARAFRRVLTNDEQEICVKSPNNGTERLRKALAAYLARSRGMVVLPEQIVVGAGAEYLYGLIFKLLRGVGAFAIEAPSYEKIERVYLAEGAVLDHLTMGTDGILTSELARTQAQVLHVTPYNSYPSGVTASPFKQREYLQWARERQGWIVEDDFCSEFVVGVKKENTLFTASCQSGTSDEHESGALDGRVIYINTFSRSLNPALRMGYMVLPPSLLAEFTQRVGFYSCTVPTLEQYVLAEILQNGEFERHVNRVRRLLRK